MADLLLGVGGEAKTDGYACVIRVRRSIWAYVKATAILRVRQVQGFLRFLKEI